MRFAYRRAHRIPEYQCPQILELKGVTLEKCGKWYFSPQTVVGTTQAETVNEPFEADVMEGDCHAHP